MADQDVSHTEAAAEGPEAVPSPLRHDEHGMRAAVSTPQPPSFFFGAGGLRWGWAIALFLSAATLFTALGLVALVKLHALSLGGADSRLIRPWTSASVEAVRFGSVLLATLVLAALERRRVGRYGLGTPRNRVAQIAAGAAWGLLLVVTLVGVLWKTGVLVVSAPMLHGVDALQWGAAWLLPFVGTGLFEEVGFRGALQFTLTRGLAGLPGGERSPQHRKALGFWLGAVLLACLFGGVHLQNQGEAATGAIAAALIGLVFSFSLWRTGSLWWAVGFHAVWDWAESFLFGVSDSGTVAVHTMLQGKPQGNPLLSGGTVGPEGSLWVFPTIALAALIVAYTLPSQPGSPSNPAYQPEA